MSKINEIMQAVDAYGDRCFEAGDYQSKANAEKITPAFAFVREMIAAALADAERKGAERMREAAAQMAVCDWPERADSVRICSDIRAMPLPTEIQPAKTEVHLMRADGTPSGVVIVKQGVQP